VNLLDEVPEHLDQWFGKRVEIDVEFSFCSNLVLCYMREGRGLWLTLDVVLGVGIIALVVMDQLDHMEQVILTQLHQTICQLLHVDTARTLSLLLAIRLLARTVLLAWDGSSLPEDVNEGGGGVLEGDNMGGLVGGLGEVEIVREGCLAAFLGSVQVDGHVKLAPSFI
jgi:hypothetical protein